MPNAKISQLPSSTSLTVNDLIPVVDVSENQTQRATVSQVLALAGTVTSVSGDGGTTGLTLGGGPITTIGTLTIGGTLNATHGGTGHSGYTVGDILFAGTTSTLSRLAGVSTGNALISGGVGTAPSWGKVGLTTHVSGTLPVANGGTGQTTYTDGQLLIGNSTGNTLTKSTLTADTNIAVTNGAGTISIGLTGTVGVANGGTGAATLAANNVLLGNGTSALQTVAPGTNGNVLTSNGTTWTSAALPAAPVTSVSGAGGNTGLTLSGGPTGSVTLTLGGTLDADNGEHADQTSRRRHRQRAYLGRRWRGAVVWKDWAHDARERHASCRQRRHRRRHACGQ